MLQSVATTDASVVTLTIGPLSKRSGVNVETIRYYERIGLIPPAVRSEGRTRHYGDDDVKRLVFIRRSREIGFSLDDIRNLLKLAERGHSCGDVRQMALAHVERIRGKITDLERMEHLLLETASKCEGGTAPDCPILEAIGR